LSYHFNFSFDTQNLPFIHNYSHIITTNILLNAVVEKCRASICTNYRRVTIIIFQAWKGCMMD
jgi:hypothetical protein